MTAGKRRALSDLLSVRFLRWVVATAELGSIRKAAQALEVEPSAVSRTIRDLEDELGTSIFDRSASGVRLTTAGQRFLSEIRRALDDMSSAALSMREAGRGLSGTIRIGVVGRVACPLTIGVLATFKAENPGLTFDLVQGTPDAHTRSVSSRTLDVAFVLGTPNPQDCSVEEVWTEDSFAVLSRSDKRLSDEDLAAKLLVQEEFIVSNDAQGVISEYIMERILPGTDRDSRVKHTGVDFPTLLLMVSLGLGSALACKSELQAAPDSVVFVPLVPDALQVSMVHANGNANPALRRFLNLVRRILHE